jgi:hypothetical protein
MELNVVMKDREARAVINLLNERIKQLDHEINLSKHPHIKGCKCKDCRGRVPDHMSITFDKSRGGFGWFKDE